MYFINTPSVKEVNISFCCWESWDAVGGVPNCVKRKRSTDQELVFVDGHILTLILSL